MRSEKLRFWRSGGATRVGRRVDGVGDGDGYCVRRKWAARHPREEQEKGGGMLGRWSAVRQDEEMDILRGLFYTDAISGIVGFGEKVQEGLK